MNIQISREAMQVGTNVHFKLRFQVVPAFGQALQKDKTVLYDSFREASGRRWLLVSRHNSPITHCTVTQLPRNRECHQNDTDKRSHKNDPHLQTVAHVPGTTPEITQGFHIYGPTGHTR